MHSIIKRSFINEYKNETNYIYYNYEPELEKVCVLTLRNKNPELSQQIGWWFVKNVIKKK